MILKVYKGNLDGTIDYSDYGETPHGAIKKDAEPNYQIKTLGYMTSDVLSKIKLQIGTMYQ